MDQKDTKPFSRNDADSLQLAGAISTLAGRLEEVVKIQQTLAEDLAEHSRKSAETQAALMAEIAQSKTEHLLRTGDQGKAIEILKIEREAIDNELRREVERAREDLEYYKSQQPALLKRLEKISERLERGGKEIDKGVRAWEILKWAGITVGALLLMGAVAKLYLGNGPIHVGESHPGTVGTDAISYMMAKMGAAWLGVSGIVVAAMDFRMRHLGS
jgi:hypothetical protein